MEVERKASVTRGFFFQCYHWESSRISWSVTQLEFPVSDEERYKSTILTSGYFPVAFAHQQKRSALRLLSWPKSQRVMRRSPHRNHGSLRSLSFDAKDKSFLTLEKNLEFFNLFFLMHLLREWVCRRPCTMFENYPNKSRSRLCERCEVLSYRRYLLLLRKKRGLKRHVVLSASSARDFNETF